MISLNRKFAGGCAAWVAIIAMALNALWPLLAQVKPGPAPSLAQFRAAVATEHADHHGGHHGDAAHHDSAPAEPSPLMPHCGFCTLAPGGFAVLVSDFVASVVLLIDAEEFRPASPEVRPVAVLEYSEAHPRAPPVLS